MTFHLFQSEKDQLYYFHLKARNGEIVLNSQGYQSKQGAQKGIAAVKRRGKDEGSYIANTSKNKKRPKDEGNYEMKRSKNGKMYFVLNARNGRVIGVSPLFETEIECKKTIRSIMQNL